ncbi:MAG: radical SAM protein, partial [Clostridia bacterium]|nr:radical SAM protein [Clostridia bacterium]
MTCTLCPRKCGVDREKAVGYCGSGAKMHIARAKLHYWEEPPISGNRGSGTIFFTGCSLKCAFCQNSVISEDHGHGRDFTTEEFIGLMQELEAQGAHNINLVTPTHFAGEIAKALRIYKPQVPVVWNCGGYESVETLQMLDGLVDIYLPDFKYADDALAVRVSNAPNYKENALAAIREMVRQTGENQYTPDGLLKKGVIIRHLILPAHTRDSMAVLELIQKEFPGVPVSLMSQYTPMGRVLADERFHDLNRRITVREHRKVQEHMLALELPGFCQKRSAAGERYVPDFTQFDFVNTERGVAYMTNQTELVLYSAMEKILPAGEPVKSLSALRGEETAFQAVLPAGDWHVEVRTDAAVQTAVYRVGKVPCSLTAYPDRHDEDYITTEPAEIPDILYPLEGDLHAEEDTTLWVSLKVNGDAPAGIYPVELSANGKSAVLMLTVHKAALPEQKLTFTQWFH